MPYRLRNELAFCLCGERIVLMDLDADRYFGLSRRHERLFRRIVVEGDAALAEEEGEALIAAGLLTRSDAPFTSFPQPITPTPLELFGGMPRPRARDVAEACAAQLWARFRVRRLGPGLLLRNLERRRPRFRIQAEAEAETGRIVSAFATSEMVLSRADRCLPRSIAMLAVCYRRGVDASLVFGVRADPFAAHCWVQRAGIVLTGDLDEVRMFTPIRVVP